MERSPARLIQWLAGRLKGSPGSEPSPEAAKARRGVGVAFAIGIGAALTALLISACSTKWPWSNPSSPSTGAGDSSAAALERLYESETADGTPIMRVRIARDATNAAVAGPAYLRVRTDEPGAKPRTVKSPAAVSFGASGWTVLGGDSVAMSFGRAPATRQNSSTSAPELIIASDGSALLTFDGAPLPGELHLHPDTSIASTFDVVEHVPIDQYLPGVVAKELPAGWMLEAYKAQAVAARSYALHERRRRIGLGDDFDVESTTQDQAYAGATANARAHEAVRDTRGLVLTWRGTLLRAYYSSTTGGRAASARDTWPTGPGYEFNLAAPIQASPRDDSDKGSPLYRWTVERPTDELIARFRAYGVEHGSAIRAIDSLSAIRVKDRNTYERPQTYEIVDAGGKIWTLSAESIRLACNESAPGLPAITRDMRINSGDFEATVEGDVVVFHGRGFGHGVGMSQYGAQGMARQGGTFEQILKAYYPGATLERAY